MRGGAQRYVAGKDKYLFSLLFDFCARLCVVCRIALLWRGNEFICWVVLLRGLLGVWLCVALGKLTVYLMSQAPLPPAPCYMQQHVPWKLKNVPRNCKVTSESR